MTSSLKFRGASSSSSSAHQWTYDVFLSFGGQGTRKNFTGHLYDALERVGLKTFIDYEQLRSAEEIPSKLPKAIEESRVSVVVLSENYASSTWCLEELTKIFECVEKKKHMVLPVFHGVNPSDVRRLKGTFGESFRKLAERFRDNPVKVARWRAVLREVCNIAGWELTENSYESQVVGEIVQEIAQHTDFQVAKHLDGIKFPKKAFQLHLQHNNITEAIPAEPRSFFFLISTEPRSFSKLHTLDLSGTLFNGEIPPSLGDLRSLKRMRLFNDSRTGVFTIILANLTQFTFQDEALPVRNFVQFMTDYTNLQVAKHPVRIESHVQELDLFSSPSPIQTEYLAIESSVQETDSSPSSPVIESLAQELLSSSLPSGIEDEALPVHNFVQFMTDNTNLPNLPVGEHLVRIESHVQEPDLSSSPSPIQTEYLAIESSVQETDSSSSPPVIVSLAQVLFSSSLPSGIGEQGNNPSTSSQGVILIFIGLVISLFQLGNLFETYPVDMWITVAASVMCCLSQAAMTKINGTHWTRYSQTINIFRILSGILAVVSLLSTRLPHQRWWLLFAIWALLAFIIVAGWIHSWAKRRVVETRIPLSRVVVQKFSNVLVAYS